MKEPFPHQKEGIAFLKKEKRVILADEMGLGKTFQTIVATGETESKGTLVIVPASIKINWKREILEVYPEDEITIIESGPKTEIQHAPWMIINYDMLPKYIDDIIQMAKDGKIGTLIIDEAHYIKGKKTRRAKATLQITPLVDRVYCLTGTPIENRPRELFNLLQAIGHPLGQKVSFFSKRYCGGRMVVIAKKNGTILKFYDDTGATNLMELREMIKNKFLRRLKKDVLDLPEKIYTIQDTELDREWQLKYDTAFDAYIDYLTNNPDPEKDIQNIMDARHLVELNKIKQVCSMAKVERIVQDIRNAVNQGEKVIVFTQFTAPVLEIKTKLEQKIRGSAYADGQEAIKVVTLTGQDKMDERQKSVDAFQNDEDTKVIIMNIKAGGVGLNLTKANIVMFLDMVWSPEVHKQAEDRAHRMGQAGTVNIYYYVAMGTIDEDIMSILEEKRSIIDIVVGEAEEMEPSVAKAFLEKIKEKVINN